MYTAREQGKNSLKRLSHSPYLAKAPQIQGFYLFAEDIQI
jgi:hypothetical protein